MGSSYDDIAKARKDTTPAPPLPKRSKRQMAERRAFWRAFFDKRPNPQATGR